MEDYSRRFPPSHHRDRGAAIMLAVLSKYYFIAPFQYVEHWDAYQERVREHREHHIRAAMAAVRFQILDRAGRDADWIRSMNLYGVPPVPD